MDKQPASTMNYKEVLAELEEVYQNARPYMSPKCRVCKVMQQPELQDDSNREVRVCNPQL